MKRNLYHCAGCEFLITCERAFKHGSEKCKAFVGSSFHRCHLCKNFGQECRKSGLVDCNFIPRVTGDPFEKFKEMRKEIENE